MPTQEEIRQQFDMLQIHRDTIALSLKQLAIHTPAYAPPELLYRLKQARSEVARIKKILHDWNNPAKDHPDDVEIATAETLPEVSSLLKHGRYKEAQKILSRNTTGVAHYYTALVLLRGKRPREHNIDILNEIVSELQQACTADAQIQHYPYLLWCVLQDYARGHPYYTPDARLIAELRKRIQQASYDELSTKELYELAEWSRDYQVR